MFEINKYISYLITLMACCLLFACTSEETPAAKAKELLTVTLSPAKKGNVSRYEFAEGTAHAIKREFLIFEAAGRVAMIKTNDQGSPLREGDKVRGPNPKNPEGELLAQLDVRGESAEISVARADLDNARTRLSTAKKELNRGKQLRGTGAIGASHFDNLEAEFKLALSALNASQARLQKSIAGSRSSEIRAPFDGVVSFINISEGQYVSPSQFNPASASQAVKTAPIVIIDPSSFEIIVELPAYQGTEIAAGQQAYLIDGELLASFQIHGEQTAIDMQVKDILEPAMVTAVSPALNPGDRTIRARLVTTEPSASLIDGAYITCWIRTHEKKDVLVVPQRALIHRGENSFAYVYNAQTSIVRKQLVSMGVIGVEGVEIINGLKEGDQLVVDGRYRLTDGMQVNAIAEEDAVAPITEKTAVSTENNNQQQ